MNAQQRARMERRRQQHREHLIQLSGSVTPPQSTSNSRSTSPGRGRSRDRSASAQDRGREMIERMQRNPDSVPNAFTVPAELMHEFPVALPTQLDSHLRKVVDGTALIDRTSADDRFEDVLEVVSLPRVLAEDLSQPLGDLHVGGSSSQLQRRLSVSDISAEDMHRDGTPSHVFELLNCDDNDDAEELSDPPPRRSPGVHASNASSVSGSGCRILISPTAMQREAPRHVLRNGGGVIFTDQFINENPESGIASVTHEFQLSAAGYSNSEGNPLVRATSSASSVPAPASTPPTKLHEYIDQVETQQRPLFRRVDSQRMYGRGVYLSVTDGVSSESVDGHPLRDRRNSEKMDGGAVEVLSSDCFLQPAAMPLPGGQRTGGRSDQRSQATSLCSPAKPTIET